MVIRHIAVRGENMVAVEIAGPANEALEGLADARLHLGVVVEAPLAILHLPAQGGLGVEPEAGGVLQLIARGIQVVAAISQPVQGIAIDRRALAGLDATQENPGAIHAAGAVPQGHRGRSRGQEQGAGDAAGSLDLAKAWFVTLQGGGLGTVAVDVALDHGVPTTVVEIAGQVAAGVAVANW